MFTKATQAGKEWVVKWEGVLDMQGSKMHNAFTGKWCPGEELQRVCGSPGHETPWRTDGNASTNHPGTWGPHRAQGRHWQGQQYEAVSHKSLKLDLSQGLLWPTQTNYLLLSFCMSAIVMMLQDDTHCPTCLPASLLLLVFFVTYLDSCHPITCIKHKSCELSFSSLQVVPWVLC